MSKTDSSLNALIDAALPLDNDDAAMKLVNAILAADSPSLKDAAESFEKLVEVWDNAVLASDEKAQVCLALAEASVLDSENFRESLQLAVRRLLPPYLMSNPVVKAVGAKDNAIGVRDAALRLKKLRNLRSTALLYHQDSRSWGKIRGIDKSTSAIGVSAISGTSVSSLPIASAVVNAIFFETTPEILTLIKPSKNTLRPAADYKRVFMRNVLSDLSEQKLRNIVSSIIVPSVLSEEDFDAWWSVEPKHLAADAGKRHFADSRSILELHTLLAPFADAEIKLLPENALKIKTLFTKVRPGLSPKDSAMLAECIAILSSSATPETLTDMYQPLRGKVPFFPQEISTAIPLSNLETWARLSMKHLTGFITAASFLYSARELALLASILPLRCIGPVFDTLPDEIVRETILNTKNLSADMLLWIWKNHKELPPMIAEIVDMDHIISAFAASGFPKEWGAAYRELKKALLDKADFQKFLIKNADNDIPSIITSLQKYRSAQPGERQSIMVKLARHSEELKEYIEAGEGRKALGIRGDAAHAVPEQAPVTSLKSHKKLIAELDDLINKQIPENAAAVALARSFGDLRENAEYDAAKERRRFLSRRRSDLERTLGFIQATDFKNVTVDGHVVLGSEVRLESSAGEKKSFFVLGAWDGDPENNRISYKTRIGEVLLHKKAGEAVNLPDGGTFVIREVLPIPEALRKELADEI